MVSQEVRSDSLPEPKTNDNNYSQKNLFDVYLSFTLNTIFTKNLIYTTYLEKIKLEYLQKSNSKMR